MPSRTFDVKVGDLSMDAAARLGSIRQETGFGDADILDALLLRGIDGTDPLALRKLYPGKFGDEITEAPIAPIDFAGNLIREIRVGKDGCQIAVIGDVATLYDAGCAELQIQAA